MLRRGMGCNGDTEVRRVPWCWMRKGREPKHDALVFLFFYFALRVISSEVWVE